MDAGTVPVTIALVEDDEEARSRLVASILRDPSLRITGEYRNGTEALAGLAAGAPDVFLVDSASRQAGRRNPLGRVSAQQGHARHVVAAHRGRSTPRVPTQFRSENRRIPRSWDSGQCNVRLALPRAATCGEHQRNKGDT